MGLTINPEELRNRYQVNNPWGNNLRVGENRRVGEVNPAEESSYQGSYDYSVPKYKTPDISRGTTITGLGPANDTGKLKPFLA